MLQPSHTPEVSRVRFIVINVEAYFCQLKKRLGWKLSLMEKYSHGKSMSTLNLYQSIKKVMYAKERCQSVLCFKRFLDYKIV